MGPRGRVEVDYWMQCKESTDLVEPIKAVLIIQPLLWRFRKVTLHADHDDFRRVSHNTRNAAR